MKNRNKTTKFPARIKKIMQKDEEVGKVAQATPVVISKALELFLALIVNKTHEVTAERGSRKVEAYHLKHAVETTEMLDFLKELVEAIPDPSQGGTIDLEEAAESKRKRASTTSGGGAPKSKRTTSSNNIPPAPGPSTLHPSLQPLAEDTQMDADDHPPPPTTHSPAHGDGDGDEEAEAPPKPKRKRKTKAELAAAAAAADALSDLPAAKPKAPRKPRQPKIAKTPKASSSKTSKGAKAAAAAAAPPPASAEMDVDNDDAAAFNGRKAVDDDMDDDYDNDDNDRADEGAQPRGPPTEDEDDYDQPDPRSGGGDGDDEDEQWEGGRPYMPPSRR